MVKIHPEGRIIDKKYLWNGVLNLTNSIERSDMLQENKDLIGRFIHDARIGKTIKIGQKKQVAILRQVKYLQDLKKLDAYFRKPLDKITQLEMEQFILDLEEGRLKKNNGQPFAKETQVCMKKIIIKFYKWLFGKSRTVPELVDWIDTSIEVRDYKAIRKEDVDTILIRYTSNTTENLLRNKAIIMFLFDSGARADELLNVRLNHLTIENGNYKVRIEYSKTKKRTLSLPFSKEYLDAWLKVHPAKDEPLAQLFPVTYAGLCNVVHRGGELVKKKLTPHGLRHSSATHWARTLSQYVLCGRFGWSMNSKQPARYIDREGLDQEKVQEQATADKVISLESKNSQLNSRIAMLEDQFEKFFKGDKEELIKIIDIVKKQKEL
jgi:integrase